MGIIGKSLLSAAALSMTIGGALPATAAPSSHQVFKSGSGYEQSSNYRRGGGGWDRRHDRDGISTGDVLTGIGILAGIAIIASAASSSNNRNDAPPPPQSYPDDNHNYDYDNSRSGNNDVGAAIQACSNAAESRAGGDARVDEIRSATRDGNGWRVEGTLTGYNSGNFTCGANGGVVDFIQVN